MPVKMNLNKLIAHISDKQTISAWKKDAKEAILQLAKRSNPFRKLKLSNRYLYIDTESRTYAIILRGLKPNAGYSRGFYAPIDQRVESAPHPVFFGGGKWRTVTTERRTYGNAGLQPLHTDYIGVNAQPDQFFGLRRKSRIEAFGLADGVAVPIYSQEGFVEWITDDMTQELYSILQNAGYKAIEKEI